MDRRDTAYTDIWYSKTNSRDDAARLSTYPYPQARASLMGLAAGQSFFWGRLVDTSGNIGPWYPNSQQGVLGQSSSDATASDRTDHADAARARCSCADRGDPWASAGRRGQRRDDHGGNAVANCGDSALSQRLDVVSAQVGRSAARRQHDRLCGLDAGLCRCLVGAERTRRGRSGARTQRRDGDSADHVEQHAVDCCRPDRNAGAH